MRARFIKPGIFKNEQLAECSFAARWLFPGLWCLADCCGRLEDRPKKIKIEIFPGDNIEVEPLIDELESRGLVKRYTGEGPEGPLIWIPKFTKHQCPHVKEMAKGSILPPHPEEDFPSLCTGLIPAPDQHQTGTGPSHPITDYRLLNTDNRLPTPGESDRGVTHSESDRSKPVTGARILAATREPPEYGPWWKDVAKRLKSVGESAVMVESLDYLESSEGIQRPGAFLNSKCRDALKRHGFVADT